MSKLKDICSVVSEVGQINAVFLLRFRCMQLTQAKESCNWLVTAVTAHGLILTLLKKNIPGTAAVGI
jgi:hypothetical protein